SYSQSFGAVADSNPSDWECHNTLLGRTASIFECTGPVPNDDTVTVAIRTNRGIRATTTEDYACGAYISRVQVSFEEDITLTANGPRVDMLCDSDPWTELSVEPNSGVPRFFSPYYELPAGELLSYTVTATNLGLGPEE